MSRCSSCGKAVYPNDRALSLDGAVFHKACAKCSDCNCQITLSNFAKAPDDRLFCKTHYLARFRQEGVYMGGDQFKHKSAAEVRMSVSPRADGGTEGAEPLAATGGDAACPTSPPLAEKRTVGPPRVSFGFAVVDVQDGENARGSRVTSLASEADAPATLSPIRTSHLSHLSSSISSTIAVAPPCTPTSTTATTTATASTASSIADDSQNSVSARPVSDRIAGQKFDRATLSAEDIKARRATFGGMRGAQSFTTDKCSACGKSVFHNDPQIRLDGARYHKACSKCKDCGSQITLANFTKAPDNTLLCKTHYFARFKTTGTYMGGEQFAKKGTAEIRKADSVASGLTVAAPSGAGASPHDDSASEPASPVFPSPGQAWEEATEQT